MKSVRTAAVLIGLVLTAASMTGCIEYTNSLCNAENLSDVAKIEGDRKLTLFDMASMDTQTLVMKVERLAQGKYSFEGQPVEICKVGGKYVIESQTPNNTFKASVISPFDEGGFSVSDLVVGKSTLEELNIPYTIEKRKYEDDGSLRNRMIRSVGKKFGSLREDDTYDVLVIGNTTDESQAAFTKHSSALSLGFMFR
ncbi:MAG: hypothetical protein AB7O96_17235 [Pseudobdellovibrionaceae bacterium]